MSSIARDGSRLWGALAGGVDRPEPPKGADVFGAWVRGRVARRAHGRSNRARAEAICERSDELRNTSDAALREVLDDCRAELLVRGDAADLIDEAFALGRESVRRELGFGLHVEQVMGALAIVRGACAEMATGEGKTVTAILPAAVWAWRGRGVHVLTVNDYLAERDAETTRAVYQRMGVSVGIVKEGLDQPARQAAYLCGVTYAAEKQAVFDFLRDRLVTPVNARLAPMLLDELGGRGRAPETEAGRRGWQRLVVQRGLYAAIVDEADSVLIDEAVTPAIISGAGADGDAPGAPHYRVADEIAKRLDANEHYRVRVRDQAVRLTDAGRDRVAELSAGLDPFWAGPRRREEIVARALSAHELYRRDDDYVVLDGDNGPEVQIVDRSTGRVLPGRQWQMGLHQAVEAKEGVRVTADRDTNARISYQRFFQRYKRLAGMSGTVWEVRNELWRTYELPVVRVPTHKPVIREKAPDRVSATEAEKMELVAGRVAELHATRRPVLVGTRSVAASERLGSLLAGLGVECRILNAHREEEEAEIVALAGKPGAVTVATNMAGRGTDIALTPETRELGGLVVIATERHDEARVDRQLYGRSGRQGDPGRAEVYVSFEDRLIDRHGPKWLIGMARGWSAPGRDLVRRLLWWAAQRSAAERYAVARAETAKADAAAEVARPEHGR